MQKLLVFESVSVDGYFCRPDGDMRFTHRADDAEFQAWVAGNASGGGNLLFGRKTYEMMASFWPTPAASQQFPAVAKGMNAAKKHVASRTLQSVGWQNTELLAGDLATAVRELKAQAGPGITILGSGSIAAQLFEAGLIDTVQLVITPVALGRGRTIFDGVTRDIQLQLVTTRAFGNGNVVVTYAVRS